MKREYPWYGIAEENDELEQGDYIDDCKVLIPKYIPSNIDSNTSVNLHEKFATEGVVEIRDVIILTQSCDLENTKVEYIKLCPRISLSQYVELKQNAGQNLKSIAATLNDIRLGRRPRYYMLQRCDIPGFEREIQIVDLGTAYSVPFDILKEMVKFTGKRIQLLSPYKEQLAQAFAFFYMRVALPDPINEFKPDTLKILLLSSQ